MSAMYCKTCGQDSAELLRMVADLKRRVRLARREMSRLVNTQYDHTDAIITESNLEQLLDLRRPLPKGRR